MYRKPSSANTKRQYPTASALNNPVQAQPEFTPNRNQPPQTQWTDQNWPATQSQFEDVNLYTPSSYEQPTHPHQQQNYATPQPNAGQESWWNQNQQPTTNSDPWNWELNTNNVVGNVQENNDWSEDQGQSEWDWQVPESNNHQNDWNAQNQVPVQPLYQEKTIGNTNNKNKQYSQVPQQNNTDAYQTVTSQITRPVMNQEPSYENSVSQPNQHTDFNTILPTTSANTALQEQYTMGGLMPPTNDLQYANNNYSRSPIEHETVSQNLRYDDHSTEPQVDTMPDTYTNMQNNANLDTNMTLTYNNIEGDVVDRGSHFSADLYNVDGVTNQMGDLGLNKQEVPNEIAEISTPSSYTNEDLPSENLQYNAYDHVPEAQNINISQVDEDLPNEVKLDEEVENLEVVPPKEELYMPKQTTPFPENFNQVHNEEISMITSPVLAEDVGPSKLSDLVESRIDSPFQPILRSSPDIAVREPAEEPIDNDVPIKMIPEMNIRSDAVNVQEIKFSEEDKNDKVITNVTTKLDYIEPPEPEISPPTSIPPEHVILQELTPVTTVEEVETVPIKEIRHQDSHTKEIEDDRNDKNTEQWPNRDHEHDSKSRRDERDPKSRYKFDNDDRYSKAHDRSRDLSSTKYNDRDESYERGSYNNNDRMRGHHQSRGRYDRHYDDESRNYDRYSRENSPARYGRRSRDNSRSRYGQRSRENSRTRYDEYYRGRDEYYGHYRRDNPQGVERPSSRQNFDESYRSGYGYEDNHRGRDRDYRRNDGYYRDGGRYDSSNNNYDRLREQDYLYRKLYHNSNYGRMGAYNYGFFDELYHSDPMYRKVIEKYRQYYQTKSGYQYVDGHSIHSSGRNSATNDIRRADSFTQEYQQGQPNSTLPYNLSSINPDQTQNYTTYGDSTNAVEEKEPTVEPVAQEPLKFTTPHAAVSFSSNGHLIKVLPNDPRLGAPPTVEIFDSKVMQVDESFKEFPGPLIIGETHKNDIIQFCKSKLRVIPSNDSIIDKDSARLLWEYLILMIRQNGSVAGTDIADLLIKDRPFSTSDEELADLASPDEGIFESVQKASPDQDNVAATVSSHTTKVVDKFREYLLFGHKKDALDWAVKNGLWGHALFLASKMDKRTHGMIMTKFANSLQLNDPLQTLYQLMSGRQPASVTCVADEGWGDWRQHLAMILSNATSKVDVDKKSITTLGDTLASRGCLHAAHFCYLMARSSFGTYSSKAKKLVLIGSSHHSQFNHFATNEAIQYTEIYEFATKLAQPSFVLPHFQHYKFLYSIRLLENGFNEEALHYCEVISGEILKSPAVYSPDLVSHLHDIALKLKFNDPHYTQDDGDVNDICDPQWITNLGSVHQAYKSGTIQHVDNEIAGSMSSLPTADINEPIETNQADYGSQQYQQNYHQNNIHPAGMHNGSVALNEQPVGVDAEQNQYAQNIAERNQCEQNMAEIPPQTEIANNYQDGQHQQHLNPEYNAIGSDQSNEYNNQWNQPNNFTPYDNNLDANYQSNQMAPPGAVPGTAPSFDYYAATTTAPNIDTLQQHTGIKRRTSNTSTSSFERTRRDSHRSTGSGDIQPLPQTNQANQKPPSSKQQQQANSGGGLLYGLFQKLSFRPKNQMILPDDKDPTIVWDESNKKWTNKDGDEDSAVNGPAAPPSDAEISGSSMPPMNNGLMATPLPNSNPMPPPGSSNRFQKPKNKSLRSNYVDIFAGGQPKKPAISTNIVPDNNVVAAPNYFVPSPAVPNKPTDYSTTNNTETQMTEVQNVVPTLSRSSSQSSLSREVQSYMIPNSQPQMKMFNPSDFSAQQSQPVASQPGFVRGGPRNYPR